MQNPITTLNCKVSMILQTIVLVPFFKNKFPENNLSNYFFEWAIHEHQIDYTKDCPLLPIKKRYSDNSLAPPSARFFFKP